MGRWGKIFTALSQAPLDRVLPEVNRTRSFSNTALAAPAAGRRSSVAFVALRHRDFRAFLGTAVLSQMADNIEHVITYWIIWQAFHSPQLSGFAVISHWAPFLLFSVYFGTLADRYDCRRILQISQVTFMCLSLSWGLLFLTGRLEVWHAVVLLIIHGFAGALAGPGQQLIIHDIVGPEQLQSGVRLNATGFQLSILLGPAVGGALMVTLGPAIGIMVNALFSLPRIMWLFLTPYTGHGRETGPPIARIGLREALRVLRELSSNRTIIAMVTLAGANSLLIGGAYQVQMPAFAHRLGTDNAGIAYSALLMANGAGAIISGLLLESVGFLQPRGRSAIIAASLWALAISSFAVAPIYPLALTLLFLAGAFNLAFSSMAQTLVQLLAPSRLRGGAVGLYNMTFGGLRVGSGVTVGVLGSLIGVNWWLGVSGAILFVITLLLLVFTFVGQREPVLSQA